MGHDIIAGGFTDHQVDQIHERIAGTQRYTPEQWEHRFDDLPLFAAHLRRSSFDPYGKVIYRALGVEDNAYGGASGKGVAAWFSRVEVKQAQDLLPSVVADAPPPIDTTQVEELEKAIAELGLNHLAGPASEDEWLGMARNSEELPGISEEFSFFDDILRWMDVTEQDSIRIYFG